ncbi:hypothetical protein HOF92_12400 [bacterium]|jgi:indole-3-glycerol phosphate synthase|nr:hypothetical protein [bacterium]
MSDQKDKLTQLIEAKSEALSHRKSDSPLEKIFHQIQPAKTDLYQKILSYNGLSLILEADRLVMGDCRTKDFPPLEAPWFAGISVQYGVNFPASPEDLNAASPESWRQHGKIISDLIIEPYEIYHARYCGFDCITIYMGSVTDSELLTLFLLGRQFSMSTILVTGSEKELDSANSTPARMIAMHERDSFGNCLDLEEICELAEAVPEQTLLLTRLASPSPEKLDMLKEAEINAVILSLEDFHMNQKKFQEFFPL